jgi:outer membrane protein, heavy metal efflux system
MTVLAIAGLIALAPGSPPPITLEAVLEEVEARAPDVRVQREAVAVARTEVGVAGAWEDPLVTIMAEGIPFRGTGGEGMGTMVSYRFGQELNLFGRRRLAKRAASARVDVERALLRRAAWDARALAAVAFFELWMLAEMDAILERQLAALSELREASLDRYRAGLPGGHHEFLRAEAESRRVEAERAALGDEREAMAAMLNVLRGRPADRPVGAPVLPPRRPLPDARSVLARGGGRPELDAMRAMRAEMVARRDLVRRMYYPMVMVEGSYEQRLGEHDTFGAAVMLRVPLWFWDRQDRELEMARAMVRRADHEVEAMAAMTDADLRMAWSRARAAERRLEVLEGSALPAMREAVDSSRAAYVAGTGDFLSLLDGVLALQMVEMERLEAIVALESGRHELARLLGGPLPGGSP